jgi:hypothetical protein
MQENFETRLTMGVVVRWAIGSATGHSTRIDPIEIDLEDVPFSECRCLFGQAQSRSMM